MNTVKRDLTPEEHQFVRDAMAGQRFTVETTEDGSPRAKGIPGLSSLFTMEVEETKDESGDSSVFYTLKSNPSSTEPAEPAE